MPTVDPLVIIEGNAPAVRVSFTLDAAPWDLTGAVVRFVAKARPDTDDADADADWSSDDPSPRVTITDAAGGTATVQFEAGDLATGTHFHRIDVIDGSGRATTARYGPLTVLDV